MFWENTWNQIGLNTIYVEEISLLNLIRIKETVREIFKKFLYMLPYIERNPITQKLNKE